jgi:hypothetical protein
VANPLLPLRIVRDRNRVGSLGVALLNTAATTLLTGALLGAVLITAPAPQAHGHDAGSEAHTRSTALPDGG